MWILSLVLGSALISPLVADPEAELENCQKDVNLTNLQDLVKMPEVQELDVYCPVIFELLDCVGNVIKNSTGYTVVELAEATSDANVRRSATHLVNTRNVFDDVCTEGADLNTAYKEHGTCLSSVNVEADICKNQSSTAYNAYKSLEENLTEGSNTTEEKCFTEVYKSACVAALVHNQCGQAAFDIYQQLVKRSSLFSLVICSEQDLENLKTKFLDSLNLEEERQNLFGLFFDLRKRKK